MHITKQTTPQRSSPLINKMKKHPTPTTKAEGQARSQSQTRANARKFETTKTTSVQHQEPSTTTQAASNPSTKQTALTFGTLLSSQRTDTHPPQPSDHLGGNPVNTTGSGAQCQSARPHSLRLPALPARRGSLLAEDLSGIVAPRPFRTVAARLGKGYGSPRRVSNGLTARAFREPGRDPPSTAGAVRRRHPACDHPSRHRVRRWSARPTRSGRPGAGARWVDRPSPSRGRSRESCRRSDTRAPTRR